MDYNELIERLNERAAANITLSREQLYQKVWSTPARDLAKEFGISDVSIGKLCRKYNIPKPQPGYWQKIKHGRKVVQLPLPDALPGEFAEIVISPHVAQSFFAPQDPEVVRTIDAESQPDNRIVVEDTLENPLPLISHAKQILEKAGTDQYNLLRGKHNEAYLDLRVSRKSLSRALRIMNAFLKALIARGYSCVNSKKHPSIFSVHIGGQDIRFHLQEKVDRIEKIPSADQQYKSDWSFNRWNYVPSGHLLFIIDEYHPDHSRKKWTDSMSRPLEAQLNEVMIGIILTAEALRLKAISDKKKQQEKREAEHRRLEAEKLKKEEDQREKILEDQAVQWAKARNLRAFIQACEEDFVRVGGAIMPDSPEARWLKWASAYADNLDPLKSSDLKKSISQP